MKKMIWPKIKTLYKYREFNGYSTEALATSKVWISDIRNFNDPLETHYRIEDDLGLSKYDILHKSAKEIYLNTNEHLKRKGLPIGVLCLSESNDIELMWSHYTDGHRGFCIGYVRSESNVLGDSDKCIPMQYTKTPPTLLYSVMEAVSNGNQEATSQFAHNLIYNKDVKFRYEKEWRLCFKRKNLLTKLDAPIQSITFGCNMPKNRRNIVRDLLSNKTDIGYYEAIPSMDSYNMTIQPLS